MMRVVKVVLKGLMWGIGIIVAGIIAINIFAQVSTLQQKVSVDEVGQQFDEAPVVVVLGAGVTPNKEPSLVLKKRLDKASEIYQQYPEATFIMSGDHQGPYYNEVSVMKAYLSEQAGIPSHQIYLDHLGINTYSSMYRLQQVFGVNHVAVVTQSSHLSRALMMANGLGLEAVGISASEDNNIQLSQFVREVGATVKAFAEVYTPLKPTVVYESNRIDMNQGGDQTDEFY